MSPHSLSFELPMFSQIYQLSVPPTFFNLKIFLFENKMLEYSTHSKDKHYL